MVLKVIGAVALFLLVASRASTDDVMPLDGDMTACDSVHDSISDVCELFGVDSDACVSSSMAYQAKCNDAPELGEGETVVRNVFDDKHLNSLKGTNGKQMTPEQMTTMIQKLTMAYALEKRSAGKMRAELAAKEKECGQSGEKAEAEEKAALEAEEKAIENDKPKSNKELEKKVNTKETAEQQKAEKELEAEEKKIEQESASSGEEKKAEEKPAVEEKKAEEKPAEEKKVEEKPAEEKKVEEKKDN